MCVADIFLTLDVSFARRIDQFSFNGRDNEMCILKKIKQIEERRRKNNKQIEIFLPYTRTHYAKIERIVKRPHLIELLYSAIHIAQQKKN